jgi:3-phosphoshikimate 1-carboxyvinyltransferase
MNLKINPITNNLNGEITAPGSKSYSHRAFIAASLANGISIIKHPLTKGDVQITMNLLRKLGVKIQKKDDNSYIVIPNKNLFRKFKKSLDCGNSGTTFRIFSVLSLLIEGGLILTGDFLKKKRPILPLLKGLIELGAKFTLTSNKVKIRRNKIACNKIKIRGDVSSQFITALLMICPLLKCKEKSYIEIELTTPLVSKPFVEITLDLLNSFGISIKVNFENGRFFITNEQIYRSQLYKIPGDFSSAAFLISAAVLSSKQSRVVINNLNMNDAQGDKKIIEILSEMGAKIEYDEEKNQLIINGGMEKYPLTGIEINCNDIPDLFPILTVIGAFANGKTILYNVSNLRIKESDRIASMAQELSKMGVKLIEENDKFTIFHSENINGIKINHYNDHRIAMACSIAALYAKSNSVIADCEIVYDSYPTFFEDLKELGVHLEIMNPS